VIEVSEGRRIDFGPKRRRERGDPGLLRRRLLHRGCDGPDRPRRSGSRDLVHRPDGVVDIPFGWPLRYSHSPVEVIDLEDLVVLSDWIRAIVEGW
jgi:hypothetical protein